MLHIDIPDNSFDVVICNHVLEHILDDRKAIYEIFRILKYGGWAILQVPINGESTFEDCNITLPKDRERVFGQWDHVRIYGKDYVERLREVGFKVKVDKYVKSLSDDQVKYMGLIVDEDIYYCYK